MLQALVRKTETIRESWAASRPFWKDVSPSDSSRALTATATPIRRRPKSGKRRTARNQEVDEELEAARERAVKLQQQLDTLRDLLKTSESWLGLNEESFRDAISCALELDGIGAT